ncbi:MAG TPA: substrate-binding domain-containing protein [Anaerolineae bacterium]
MRTIALNPRLTTPLYEQIAQSIRDQIGRGEHQPGDALPTVRELARQLDVNQNTVVHAYSLLRREGLIEAHASQGTRVALAAQGDHLRETRAAELRLLISRAISDGVARGFTLAEIEAAFTGQRARWSEEQRGASGPVHGILGFGSHDLSLELLLSRFHQTHPETRLNFATVGSLAGLVALARNEARFAAAHLYDPASDDYNAPFVRRLLPGREWALVTLVERAQGFIVAKGNPKKIRSVRDLTRRGIRIVNRQQGSGTRVLMDELLKRARVARGAVRGYTSEETTHPGVAAAIAGGAADVGLGIQAAARAFDVDFIPLAHERFEIILPRSDVLIGQLCQVINSPEFRQAVESLGGYDLTKAGQIRYV